PTGILFSAVGSGKSQIATTPVTTQITTVTTTTTTTVTTTSVPVTTTETPVVTDISGDVNADGKFNISDIVMLQKWLLGIGDLTDWKAADLYKDDIINVYDLSLMRRMLIE
ncbi:MAG: dockerin type I repeat-containing protein, partial [Porcipelethomonas sp.]